VVFPDKAKTDIFQETNDFLGMTSRKKPSPAYLGELKMKK